MKCKAVIVFLLVLLSFPRWSAGQENQQISFDFYGDSITFPSNAAAQVAFTDTLSNGAITSFFDRVLETDYQPVIQALLAYKQQHNPDDWVYYQLIRRTAQAISPKAANYYRYTLYKCFLLSKSGYDVALNIVENKLLFFAQSGEDISDIPCFHHEGKKYICLNYHDYDFNIDFECNQPYYLPAAMRGAAQHAFSYKLTQLPDFRPEDYYDKELEFSYHDVNYRFRIKLNDAVKKMFVNYPVADYQLYFNEPLSKETYNTLIPQLKEHMRGMRVKNGIDYLMHFTRYAFSYEPDQENFGREKHLSPEQTLLYDRSDCEDRAALFYCLVKEIYNLPMIVLAFPHHLTIAVKLDKPVGQQIVYNGVTYSACEPTPQAEDLPVGALSPDLRTATYEVAYSYNPAAK